MVHTKTSPAQSPKPSPPIAGMAWHYVQGVLMGGFFALALVSLTALPLSLLAASSLFIKYRNQKHLSPSLLGLSFGFGYFFVALEWITAPFFVHEPVNLWQPILAWLILSLLTVHSHKPTYPVLLGDRLHGRYQHVPFTKAHDIFQQLCPPYHRLNNG